MQEVEHRTALSSAVRDEGGAVGACKLEVVNAGKMCGFPLQGLPSPILALLVRGSGQQ